MTCYFKEKYDKLINKFSKYKITQLALYIIYFIIYLLINNYYLTYIRNGYEPYKNSNFMYCALLAINAAILFVVAAVLLLRNRIPALVKKITMHIIWLLIPPLTFTIVEKIVGNTATITQISVIRNLGLYYIIYFFLAIFISRIGILALIYSGTFMVLALAQYFVMLFRGRPFMLYDIIAAGTALTVADTYVFRLPYNVYGYVMLGFLLVIVSQLVNTRIFEKLMPVRIAFFALTVLAVVCWEKKQEGEFLQSVNMWDVASNYREDGLLLTLLEQIPYMSTDAPEGYSVEKVSAIFDKVEYIESKPQTVPQNIILIMNESFADLEYIGKIATEEEFLPFWNSLKENVIKGYLRVPVYGAGTSNVEYEVLTGNSMEFMPIGSTPYQMNVRDGEISMVGVLKQQGYSAIALHPYDGENWNRLNVYKNMGFDEFISKENWLPKYKELRWCASDESAYEKVIDLCDATEDKLFLFLVTMQNHGGYASEWDDFETVVELSYEVDYPQAEQYLTLIQESNRAYENLIAHFSVEEEPTMIIMFGNHLPTIEDGFYEELFEKPLDTLSFEEQQLKYMTPFIIWTNYDIEEKYDTILSTNYFGSYILASAGAQMSTYQQFLLELSEEIPIVSLGGIRDKEGNWFPWSEVPEELNLLLNQYRILQYHNIFDRSNRVERGFVIAE